MLAKAEAIVSKHVARVQISRAQEARFQLLEGVASRLGGFDLPAFQHRFDHVPIESTDSCLTAARRVIEAIAPTGIPPALAVSALAREALEEPNRRRSGAYHTDFRLAGHLAKLLAPNLAPRAKVIDPACGAGILLTALMLETCGGDRQLAAEWLSDGVNAADLSPNALRGCLLSLACLTDDLDALARMRARWLSGDSLIRPIEEWQRMAPDGFDAVIGNPPWEKVKLTRHEYLRANGQSRHYGADYVQLDFEDYTQCINATKNYAREVANLHATAGSGETDLFVAFTELTRKILRPGGEAALLVPAGLIRSKTTESLRRQLSSRSSQMSVEIFENRARFFEIDTRFKFLCIHWRARSVGEKMAALELAHGRGNESGVEVTPRVQIGRRTLAELRSDLSVPEVRSEDEWLLYCRMIRSGVDWSQPDCRWHPELVREVDMTRDRRHFSRSAGKSTLPLIEGRMVHQHRFGAKAYVCGTGRSATWEVTLPGASVVRPQFFIRPDALSETARQRSTRLRAGFCDITGQTNERSLLAAIIPPGVVCGNKVPTLLFPNDNCDERLWLWVAVANSLPFDWLLRRVITTTVNYFHLLSLRMPPIEPESLPGRQLIETARALDRFDRRGVSRDALREMADLRCRADRLVLTAYGLSDDDLDLMLIDFPLIDRGQPAIYGEQQSTVTRDLLQSHARDPERAARARRRVEVAYELGAIAYLPAQCSAIRAGEMMESAHG
ncbi:Eco57I restriction-modification methylase domain-containing protein [Sphingomonas tabacisoli]|uniref:site-specific DNA-methyltransferase (adenine-specific) n=1 Tax=Sphingomonas tabacisoli TaxID=2249466 RepID=A0ABW4I6B7_9SPHN